VRNAAGEGNDVFTQTVGLAQDMATVLGTDASGAALQLGKALNDPVKGITALARAGVSFTADQKAQIKDLMAHNDLLGAQKIILGEVTREFGGGATAAADPMGKLAVQLGNVAEAIGQHLMPELTPALDKLTAFASVHAEGIGAGVGAAVSGLASGFAALARVGWAVIGPGLETVFGWVQKLGPLIAPLAKDLAGLVHDALEPLGTWAANNQGAVDAISTGLVTLASSIGTILLVSKGASTITSMATALGGLFSAAGEGGALAALANPVGIVIAIVLALGAAAVVAYQKWQPFRDAVDATASFFVDTVWPAIEKVASALTDLLGPAIDTVAGIVSGIDWGGVFDTLKDAAGTAAGAVVKSKDAIVGAFNAVAGAISRAIGPTVDFLIGLWAQYGDEVTGILVGFRDIAVAVFQRVAAIVETFVSTVQAVLVPLFDFLGAAADIAFTVLADQAKLAFDLITTAVQTFVDFMTPIWQALWGFVSDVVSGAITPIRDAIEGILRVIQGVVDIVAGIFTGDWQRIWDGVGEIVSGAVELVLAQLDQVLNFLEAVWTNALDLITAPFRGGWAALQDIVSGGVQIVKDLFQGVLDFLGSVWTNATTLITAPIKAAIALAEGFINQIRDTIGELPGKAADALLTLGEKIAGAIATAATSAVTAATNLVTDVITEVAKLPGKIVTAVGDFAGTIASGLKSAVASAINFVIDRFNDLSDIDTPFGTIGLPDIPHVSFAAGGVVPGNPLMGDSVPAMLTPGELTLTAAQQILLAQAQGQPGGNSGLTLNGPHYWGAPMAEAVAELDWAARYRMRTVS
jgi:phage-related protein